MKNVRWWLIVGMIGAVGFVVYRSILGRGSQTRRDDSPSSDVSERIADAVMVAVEFVRGFVRGYTGSRDVRVESDVFVSSPNRENDDL